MGKIEKLKLRDFKSFRKTVIPFVDGFTTVIGPNGSGKSNFLDALLFVLGAGSMKTMRAGRLTDLVHHSSKTGDAEVEVTLRSDGEKYLVSRCIDKKGSSVFRLNGKRTTKSQVVELLASMNIPAENHNFVMQGDVTAIIQMTPRQRREVIDEISGISEYNDKKEKAIRELEKVEEKIKEANIILYERKGYLGEIKKERDQALRYTRFEKKKGDLKHAIIHKDLTDIKGKYDTVTDKVFKAKGDVDGLSEQVSKISASLTNLQNRLDELNREILSKGEKEQLEISKEIEQTKSQLQITQERITNRESDINKAKDEIKAKEKELVQLEKDTVDKKESLKTLDAEKKTYDSRVAELEKELNGFMDELKEKNLLVGDIAQQLEDMNSDISAKKDSFYGLKSTVDQIRERISVLKLSVSDTTEQKQASDARTVEVEQKHGQYSRDLASLKRDGRGHQNDLDEKYKAEKDLNREYEQLNAKLDESREKYHSLQSKVATIRHMTGNTASDSVMAASRNNDLKGIIGRIEDLCEFSPEYANAIHTAAGARMHFIVTDDSDSATQAIKWLKQKKLGRTTFIPLDKIKFMDVSEQAEKALRHEGAVDLAISLVKFDKKYFNAFSYVFGETVIVKSIDIAKEIGYGTCRMATLDGDLAESSGAVTGGFKHGTLTQHEIKLVDELKARLEKYEKKKKALLSELEDLRGAMNGIRGLKGEVELKIKEQEVLVREMDGRLGEYKGFSEKHESKSAQAESQIAELKNELIQQDSVLKEMNASIREMEQKKEAVREKMDSPEAKKVSDRLNEMQRGLQTVRDTRSEVAIQANSLRSEISQVISAKKQQLNNTKKANTEFIESAGNEVNELRKLDEETRAGLKEKLEEEKRISSSIRGLIESREASEGEVRALAESRGQVQRQLEVRQSQYNEMNIEKAKLETRYTDLRKEFDENRELVEFDMAIDEMKQEIESLTTKMIRLEPINLKAVDMYEKYLTQVDTLKDKGKKLEEEKGAVLQMMEEIELRRKDVFMDAYTSIKGNFLDMYKEFFPNADDAFATIKLQNEDDPFDGGLLIEARPAGKKIKHIDSMSGGEKTLTAIAFLFAIQAYKPSPFYVLDEADAALDKANSNKLAGMIQKRARLCQFIVITHNNPMIQSSEQIVGISLDKSQASSMVEVDMKKYAASATAPVDEQASNLDEASK